MSNYADDIRRIAKTATNNGSIGNAKIAPLINESIKPFPARDQLADSVSGLIPPLNFEILTAEVSGSPIVDANGVTHTIMRAKTMNITDASGRVLFVNNINYPSS